MSGLEPFQCRRATVAGLPVLVARTGYTGEDGFEFYVPQEQTAALWDALLAAGAPRGLKPIGLGARDTLRLEARMPLYGNELGDDISPIEAGLGWAVKLDKGPFIGREAIAAVKESGPSRRTVGFRLLERAGSARHGYPVELDGRTSRRGDQRSALPDPRRRGWSGAGRGGRCWSGQATGRRHPRPACTGGTGQTSHSIDEPATDSRGTSREETFTPMESPDDRKYTKTHEWVALDGDVATIGVTDFAQSELGDITYLELPEVGDAIALNQAFGIIESVKAANDIFSPVDGDVVERNEAVVAAPEMVNSSPYDDAWLVRVRVADPQQLDALLTAEEYAELAKSSAH